jgi:serine/threonine protein kinase
MATTTPDRVGRYRVREVIGAGGFATVYRAVDERLGADVAVKVLAENHSLDAGVRERFVEEGRRLRRVRGAHLLAIHDIGQTERAQPYLVLDWADRGDLAARVAAVRQQGRRPGPGDVLVVGRAIAAGLAGLHRNHLVHRDLAPKNLLLCSTSSPPAGSPTGDGHRAVGPELPALPLVGPDEQVFLADLGLSKDLAVASGLTVATGTSGFAPPEQRDHGGTVDHRADIWAASAVVVWLAIDRPPDDGGAWQRDLLEAGWPSELVGFLTRGLARHPGDRYASIAEWSAALEHALRAESQPADSGSAPRPSGLLRRRVAVALVVVAALLLGTAAGSLATRDRGGPKVRTERSNEGQERTVVEAHGITITLEGPTAVSVGESVSLIARVRGAESWAWVGSDGVVKVETEEFGMRAQRAGRATVRLLAFGEQGRTVEATRQLHVTA